MRRGQSATEFKNEPDGSRGSGTRPNEPVTAVWPLDLFLDILGRGKIRKKLAMNAFSPNPPTFPQPVVLPKSNRFSAIKIIAAVVAIMFALLLGLIVLALIGAETGLIELMIGMVCAILPVPIYVMLLLCI